MRKVWNALRSDCDHDLEELVSYKQARRVATLGLGCLKT